jgi:hypothetical protein
MNPIYYLQRSFFVTKDTLRAVIDQLPDNKLELAFFLLKSLTEEDRPREPVPNNQELLNCFLADLLSSLSSITYDLSKEAEKNNDKILANRYAFSMKKVVESWENYRTKSNTL